jgi:hypothetical protein
MRAMHPAHESLKRFMEGPASPVERRAVVRHLLSGAERNAVDLEGPPYETPEDHGQRAQ